MYVPGPAHLFCTRNYKAASSVFQNRTQGASAIHADENLGSIGLALMGDSEKSCNISMIT
jgi:hypothetical protein